jgi:hypothetical protein
MAKAYKPFKEDNEVALGKKRITGSRIALITMNETEKAYR